MPTTWEKYGKRYFINGGYALYHITPKKNVESIRKNGLQVNKEPLGQTYAKTNIKAIFLLEDKEFIQDYIEQFKKLGFGNEYAIVEVNLPLDWEIEDDPTGISAVLSYDDIPIRYIVRITL